VIFPLGGAHVVPAAALAGDATNPTGSNIAAANSGPAALRIVNASFPDTTGIQEHLPGE